MKLHVEFTYRTEDRGKVFQLLAGGGLQAESGVAVKGAWVAMQTGRGFAIVDVKDPAKFYQLCTQWSDLGELKITPVIAADQVA